MGNTARAGKPWRYFSAFRENQGYQTNTAADSRSAGYRKCAKGGETYKQGRGFDAKYGNAIYLK